MKCQESTIFVQEPYKLFHWFVHKILNNENKDYYIINFVEWMTSKDSREYEEKYKNQQKKVIKLKDNWWIKEMKETKRKQK